MGKLPRSPEFTGITGTNKPCNKNTKNILNSNLQNPYLGAVSEKHI